MSYQADGCLSYGIACSGNTVCAEVSNRLLTIEIKTWNL